MAGKITAVGQVTLKYIEKMQDAASRTIARQLRKDHPKLFTNMKNARAIVRYYRGRQGDHARKNISEQHSRFVLPKPTPENPHSLPDTWAEEYKPYILPRNSKLTLVMGDVHIPFQDNKALGLAIDLGRVEKVDTVLLNGDFADCYALSRWVKDPRLRNFPKEREAVRHALMALRKAFPSQKFIYKQGNHEFRFESLLRRKAPDFYGMEEFQLRVLFGLYEMNMDWLADKRFIQVGRLNIGHGDEWFARGDTVNPARTAFLKAKECIMISHRHQASSHTGNTVRSKVIGAWSTGCLCNLHPEFLRHNEWNQGCAIVEQQKDEDFQVFNFKRIKSRLVPA
jgi:predicted phosphodiesterase